MGVFHFKEFHVDDHGCGMKICSDSVLLGAWFLPCYRDASAILDVGTGSGVLALLAAQICPQAIVTGVEIDEGAYLAARDNFAASPFASRLAAQLCDINTYVPEAEHDLIICNPPYFTNGERSADGARSGARHQDTLTFDTLMKVPLAPGGHLGIVTPADAYDKVLYPAEFMHRKLRRLCRVSTAPGKEPSRLLWDFCTDDGDFIQENLHLRDADGNYSEAYRAIVEPYYQKLSQR